MSTTPTPVELKKKTKEVTSFTATRHRFGIGDKLVWNEAVHPYNSEETSKRYNDIHLGIPRNIPDSSQLAYFHNYDDGESFHAALRLANANTYFPCDLTYRQFVHCCGPRVDENIPKEKLRFLRGVWLIVGGRGLTEIGVESPTTNPHYLQFTRDWKLLQVASPDGTLVYTTDRRGLKAMAEYFKKSRPQLIRELTPVNIQLIEDCEVSMTKKRVDNFKERLNDAVATTAQYRRNNEATMAAQSVWECRLREAKEGIAALIKAEIPCEYLTNHMANAYDNCSSYRREVVRTTRRVNEALEHENTLRRSFENLTKGPQVMRSVARLLDSKVLAGVSVAPKRLRFLFNGFNIHIRPSEKCQFENNPCRCQIIVPGDIKIPSFFFSIFEFDDQLMVEFEKHKAELFHPHFRADAKCFGGYEEFIYNALAEYDMMKALLIVSDYVHSFNVHSLLTDSRKLDFTPSKKRGTTGRYGIFTMNPETYEEDNDETDDTCEDCGGDGCEACGG